MMEFLKLVTYQPILQTLLWLYDILGNNLGYAIIALTIIIRIILIPFTLPQLKSAKKMALLKPELDSLKKKHGHDAKLFQQKQIEFYKTHNVNPAAGCLPFIAQFIVLIALYQVFLKELPTGAGGHIVNFKFLIWTLNETDAARTFYILPVLAGILQFIMSLTILPAIENEPEKRPGSVEDKKDVADMATTMQQQMVFMMPIMTIIFSIQFASGLALYWVVTTAFSLIQQLLVSGPGALLFYAKKYKLIKGK
jgi:YidC/Oxa1 family membrane protein insertase